MTDIETRERLTRVEVILEEARVDIKDMLRESREAHQKLAVRVSKTEEAIQAAQIGWRVLLTIGTIAMSFAATLGALVAKFIPWLSSLPK